MYFRARSNLRDHREHSPYFTFLIKYTPPPERSRATGLPGTALVWNLGCSSAVFPSPVLTQPWHASRDSPGLCSMFMGIALRAISSRRTDLENHPYGSIASYHVHIKYLFSLQSHPKRCHHFLQKNKQGRLSWTQGHTGC